MKKKPVIGISANFAWNLYNRKNLLLALKEDYNLFTVSCTDGNERLLQEELGFKFIPIALNNAGLNLFADLASCRAYKKIYETEKPDLVLHFNNKPNIYGGAAAGRLGIPFINNITGLGTAFEKKGILQSVLVFLYKRTFKAHSGFAFFQNTDDRAQFLTLGVIDEKRTGLLPGSGIDTERYKPDAGTASLADEGAGCKDSRDFAGIKEGDGKAVNFLFSGRLIKTKGIYEYIEAARRVRAVYKNAFFYIIGQTEDNKRFIEHSFLQSAVEDGSVIYCGLVENPEPLMRQADCIVLPSYYREGVPRVLLEGAAMGKPLIAADSIGTREPVRENENGFLCKPENTGSLTEKLIAFLLLPPAEKKRMGASSRNIAVKYYSDTIIIDRYRRQISRLISNR